MSLPLLEPVKNYGNAMIFGKDSNYSDYKDYNSKLDKEIGAKLKGKIALSALPKTISQTTLGGYYNRGSIPNS